MSNYGSREGLADRLANWSKRLSEDKSFPWVGTGLIADLNAATEILQDDPRQMKLEFDL